MLMTTIKVQKPGNIGTGKRKKSRCSNDGDFRLRGRRFWRDDNDGDSVLMTESWQVCDVPRTYVPVPMFPGTYIPQFRCSPVPMFPEPMFPGAYVRRYRYSPVPMFPGTDVPRYRCSSVPMFPEPYINFAIRTAGGPVPTVTLRFT